MQEILLGTFNGAPYLPTMFGSLLEQVQQADRVLLRDDGSTDRSLEVIHSWRARGLPIEILSDRCDTLGPKGNFARLLTHSTGDFVYLADQDDVWSPYKIQRLTKALNELQDQYGSDTPLYAYSDTRLIDSSGAPIAASGWRAQGFRGYAGLLFNRLLIENMVNGCTLAVNRTLIDRALPMPDEAVMHDWWLILVGSCFGHGVFLNDSLVSYRQHGDNTLGATEWGINGVAKKLQPSLSAAQHRVAKGLAESIKQARRFYLRYGDVLPSKQRRFIENYIGLPERPAWSRRYRAARHGVRKQSWLRTVAVYWALSELKLDCDSDG